MSMRSDERAALEAIAKDSRYDRSVAARAQFVLWWADGHSISDIAHTMQTTRTTVYKWVKRYISDGINGVVDQPRPGRPRSVSDAVRLRIAELSQEPPPTQVGQSRWSASTLALHLQRAEGITVSIKSIYAVWEEFGISPSVHRKIQLPRPGTQDLHDAVVAVVGVYLSPPVGAVLLTRHDISDGPSHPEEFPLMPMAFTKYERRGVGYVRHSTTSSFHSFGTTFHAEHGEKFRDFVEDFSDLWPTGRVYGVLDGALAPYIPRRRDWHDTKITFYGVPKGASWLEELEVWLGVITNWTIRHSDNLHLLRGFVARINSAVVNWPESRTPLAWHATPSESPLKMRVRARDFARIIRYQYLS